jgi:hypothetical protein
LYVLLFPFVGMAVEDAVSVKLIYYEYKRKNKKDTQFKIQLVKMYAFPLDTTVVKTPMPAKYNYL